MTAASHRADLDSERIPTCYVARGTRRVCGVAGLTSSSVLVRYRNQKVVNFSNSIPGNGQVVG